VHCVDPERLGHPQAGRKLRVEQPLGGIDGEQPVVCEQLGVDGRATIGADEVAAHRGVAEIGESGPRIVHRCSSSERRVAKRIDRRTLRRFYPRHSC